MRERDRRQGRGQGREDSYLLTVCSCVCVYGMCVPAFMHIQYVSQQSIDPVVEPKKSIRNPEVIKRTKCDRLGLVAVSRVHSLSLHA